MTASALGRDETPRGVSGIPSTNPNVSSLQLKAHPPHEASPLVLGFSRPAPGPAVKEGGTGHSWVLSGRPQVCISNCPTGFLQPPPTLSETTSVYPRFPRSCGALVSSCAPIFAMSRPRLHVVPRLCRSHSAHNTRGRSIWLYLPPWPPAEVPAPALLYSGSVSGVACHAPCPPHPTHTQPLPPPPPHICAHQEDRPSPQKTLGLHSVRAQDGSLPPLGFHRPGPGVSGTIYQAAGSALQACLRITQRPCQNPDAVPPQPIPGDLQAETSVQTVV